eukprot:1158077-Pelagomonas_calceolata.AAC.2
MVGRGAVCGQQEKHTVFHTDHCWASFKFQCTRCVGQLPRGCAQVTRGRSDCKAMPLPASACTPVLMGHPTSTLPQCPPAKSDITA